MNMTNRIIALALLAALCLSLAACGGSSEPGKELIGTWKSADGNTLTFKADGSGTVPATGGTTSQCTWRYDEKAEVYIVDLNYTFSNVTVAEKDGKQVITYNGTDYTKQ